jgi:hypothetical protein
MRDGEIGGHVGTAGGFPVVHMENNVIMVEAVAKIDVNRGYGKPPRKNDQRSAPLGASGSFSSIHQT